MIDERSAESAIQVSESQTGMESISMSGMFFVLKMM
jgi:hypothetical protein